MPLKTEPVSVLPSARPWPLFDAAASRCIEADALARSAPHQLMQRAGLAVARLAMAIAPGARRVWVAAGPGNNGGDGLVAARCLHLQGWSVRVGFHGEQHRLPADAARAFDEAVRVGVTVDSQLPTDGWQPDVAIDALLGLGASRAPSGEMARAIEVLNALPCPILAVDSPSGLCVDRGVMLGTQAVQATHTLCLLTLKPGLFTAQGREYAGRIWLDTLEVKSTQHPATAMLSGPPIQVSRKHAQHKGSFGDLLVLGGASGMTGAAALAARAALAAGAGRVFLAKLDPCANDVDLLRPELMPRELVQVLRPEVMRLATVVCGCGGGSAVAKVLPVVLHHAPRLILDADALNAVAGDDALRFALRARGARGAATLLTPHPLEAARLLGLTTSEIQSDRLQNAQALARQLDCCVVLKGSGTVVASADGTHRHINPTGNARLATAGTGDVLAGWMGGLWAASTPVDPFDVACQAVWLHGRAAEDSGGTGPLLASALIDAIDRVRGGM